MPTTTTKTLNTVEITPEEVTGFITAHAAASEG